MQFRVSIIQHFPNHSISYQLICKQSLLKPSNRFLLHCLSSTIDDDEASTGIAFSANTSNRWSQLSLLPQSSWSHQSLLPILHRRGDDIVSVFIHFVLTPRVEKFRTKIVQSASQQLMLICQSLFIRSFIHSCLEAHSSFTFITSHCSRKIYCGTLKADFTARIKMSEIY